MSLKKLNNDNKNNLFHVIKVFLCVEMPMQAMSLTCKLPSAKYIIIIIITFIFIVWFIIVIAK